MGAEARFYVYELRDPRDGAVFYVGKGQRRRLYQHEAEAAKGAYSRKCERIREIWGSGRQVDRCIVSRHADENEALQAEFDRIAEHGLENLTNVMPGGVMGAAVYLAHLAEAKKRNESRERESLAQSFVRVAPQFAMVLRAKATGNQIGAWVGGRWLDFTDAFHSLFQNMYDTLGHEFVANALVPHGVNLKEA